MQCEPRLSDLIVWSSNHVSLVVTLPSDGEVTLMHFVSGRLHLMQFNLLHISNQVKQDNMRLIRRLRVDAE